MFGKLKGVNGVGGIFIGYIAFPLAGQGTGTIPGASYGHTEAR